MPRMITDSESQIEQTVQQETAQSLTARILAQAAHPSTAGTAPKPVFVDLGRAVEPMTGWADAKGMRWPRATIRRTPALRAGQYTYHGKLWAAPGKPLLEDTGPVTFTTDNPKLLWLWAENAVARLRPPRWIQETPC